MTTFKGQGGELNETNRSWVLYTTLYWSLDC